MDVLSKYCANGRIICQLNDYANIDVVHDIKQSFGSYLSNDYSNRIIDKNEFLMPEDFRKVCSNPHWAGFNNGKKSVIEVKGDYDVIKQTIVHEKPSPIIY
jgi:hypothetical protein